VRGSEKKIIYVKDTGSQIFEEAYFVLRRGAEGSGPSHSGEDMVQEAQRIVEESTLSYVRHKKRRQIRGRLVSFLAGAAAASLLLGAGWLLLLL